MSLHRIIPAILTLTLLVAVPAFAATTFTFPLTGLEENPPVATNHFGQCTAILSTDESTLEIQCSHTIPATVGAHIHWGPPGVNGPIIFDLGDSDSPIHATWEDIPADDVADLLVGDLYVNVHSPTHPAGEIRGQLRPRNRLGERMMTFPLEGEQETPPVDNDFSGRCVFILDGNNGHLTCVHDIPQTTAAHIHVGPRGDPGPIEIDLGDGMSPIRESFTLNSFQQQLLLAGQLYVNVHTVANPAGEIRGQMDLCLEDRHTLCLNDRRFAVTVEWEVDPEDPVFSSGPGVAMPLTNDSGDFWFFSPDNVELKVKVLDACGPFGRFWVFIAGLTNVRVTITVVDTFTGEERTYENALHTPFEAVLDTQAFATCP